MDGMISLKARIKGLEEENEKLAKENADLKIQVVDLQQHQKAWTLGLKEIIKSIKKDEHQ
ncbi:MAG: hypothetical protein CMP95_06500 [Gammaproteobacteria bacterium]|nr:hypothetical protein [Gammaproteobacteria bacterium]